MLKLFKRLHRRQAIQVAISLLFIVFQVFLDLKIPEYMSEVTRLVQTQGSLLGDIIEQGVFMLLATFGSVLASVVVGYFAARIGGDFSYIIREALFDKVSSFSLAEMNHFSTSSLITRATNDVNQVRMLITMGLQLIIKAPIMGAWAISKIMGKGLAFSLITGVAIVIILFAAILLLIFVLPKFKAMQKLTDTLTHAFRENLMGLPVIRAYNAQTYQTEKFERINEELTQTQLFTMRTFSMMIPLVMLILNSLNLAIYWVGAGLISQAALSDKLTIFSNMVVFSSYAMQVIMSFLIFAMIFVFLPRAQVSAQRIQEVLETEPSLHDGKISLNPQETEGRFELKDVSFTYPDAKEPTLKHINLTIEPGQVIAVIGGTGSGKTSLVHLLARFYDASEGEVLLDGINVKELTFESLYNVLAYVPQTATLYKGTIQSNIAFGQTAQPDFSAASIEKALEIAQASDFVHALPKGIKAPITQEGTNVSGGQKQRLSIARAIHREPKIYIFDDTFSALDYRTDRNLRRALQEHLEGATIILVAQRLSTIRDADQIIVLDEGEIVGRGRHDELLRTNAVYQEIALSQLDEEEI